MNSRDKEDAIERDFKSGDLDYIYAIECLQALGYLPEDAEDKVSEWQDEMTMVARIRCDDEPTQEG
jgi:hypothetical protein